MDHLEADMDSWSHVICDSSSMPVRSLGVSFEGIGSFPNASSSTGFPLDIGEMEEERS